MTGISALAPGGGPEAIAWNTFSCEAVRTAFAGLWPVTLTADPPLFYSTVGAFT